MMKRIKIARLAYLQGQSEKVYELDLVELAGNASERFLLKYRYGKRGTDLREVCKTDEPITLEQAKEIFSDLVSAKLNKGYIEIDSETEILGSAGFIDHVEATSANKQVKVQYLIDLLLQERKSNGRARIIWSLGHYANNEKGSELTRLISSSITSYIGVGNWLEDYSIAWTLGRLGDREHIHDLERLRRSKNEAVKRIAYEALLVVSHPVERQAYLQPDLLRIPADLRQAIEQDDESLILQSLEKYINDEEVNHNKFIGACYRLAICSQALHDALVSVLRSLPFVPGFFKGVRYIFKTAELRLDAPMFAMLALRFEISRPFYRNTYDWTFIPGEGSFTPSKEIKKADTKLAYSDKTKDYFRRRVWRSLSQLGKAGNRQYVEFAKHILLSINDEYKQPIINVDSSYSYGPFASFLCFNHILYENDPNRKLSAGRRAWLTSSSNNSADKNVSRNEAFSFLWDKEAEAIIEILRNSQCADVHRFALTVLSRNSEFQDQLNENDIIQLLSSQYEFTANFIIDILNSRAEKSQLSFKLTAALLKHTNSNVRKFGLAVLTTFDLEDLDFNATAQLLVIAFSELQASLCDYFTQENLEAHQQEKILTEVLNLLHKTNDIPLLECADGIIKTLVRSLPLAVETVSLPLLERLLLTDKDCLHYIAANLLQYSQIAYQDIPDRVQKTIIESPIAAIRAIGIALIGKQKDRDLALELDSFIEIYAEGEKEERLELIKIFKRVISNEPKYGHLILQMLFPLLFRKEQHEGIHEELIHFFKTDLCDDVQELDSDTVWRLLHARSAGAQRMGMWLLDQGNPKEFSVKQWAFLAQHTNLTVREFSWKFYSEHLDDIKQNCKDALRILDNQWDDSRQFGFNYFRQNFIDEDWQPEDIVFLCDCSREDVQQFGQELLQSFFVAERGEYYLSALSQHPSGDVQQFASTFLKEYASDNTTKIHELKSYFITVLSQVNRGRVSKDRVVEFLLQEAEKNVIVAELAAEVFARVSLTVVQRDKAMLIKGMAKLKKRYPKLNLPLVANEVKNASRIIADESMSRDARGGMPNGI